MRHRQVLPLADGQCAEHHHAPKHTPDTGSAKRKVTPVAEQEINGGAGVGAWFHREGGVDCLDPIAVMQSGVVGGWVPTTLVSTEITAGAGGGVTTTASSGSGSSTIRRLREVAGHEKKRQKSLVADKCPDETLEVGSCEGAEGKCLAIARSSDLVRNGWGVDGNVGASGSVVQPMANPITTHSGAYGTDIVAVQAAWSSEMTIEERFATLSEDLVNLLQTEMGASLNVREMFQRLSDTEANALTRPHLANPSIDFSKPLESKGRVWRMFWPTFMGTAWAKRKRAKKAKSHGSGDNDSTNSSSPPKENNPKYRVPNSPPSTAQPALVPSDPSLISRPVNFVDSLSQVDPLQCGIYFHENDMLEESVYFFEVSATTENPLGLFFFGICLRHGLGIQQDQSRAFRCLIRAAQAAVVNLPSYLLLRHSEIAQKSPAGTSCTPESASSSSHQPYPLPPNRKLPTFKSAISLSDSISPCKSGTISGQLLQNRTYAPPLLHDPSSSINAIQMVALTVDISVAKSILPMPLHELGVCLRHGWGVPVSRPASAYYFRMAAAAGDPDAQIEYAYCLLKGWGVQKDKREAGKWFRAATEAGKQVVGESWIWKEKWMETVHNARGRY